MTKKDFPLQKQVISNQSAKDLRDGVFNEIALSKEEFDDEKIKNIYNDLFYLIPKKGKESHEEIVIQSLDYTHPEINENLDSQILTANEALLDKNEEYWDKSKPKEMPINQSIQDPIYGICIKGLKEKWE